VTCTRTAITNEVARDIFPAKLEGFCLDPKEEEKSFGKGTKQSLEKIADLFDGASKNYEDAGVDHVVQLRYVPERGGASSIDIVASRYAAPGGAYAMFTRRVVGDGDPADDATATSTPGGGAAALGTGNAYLWAGSWLLEIVYNDDALTPDQLEAAAKKTLAPIVQTLGARLPGATTPPAEVALLPTEHRLPLGVRYALADAIMAGVGPMPGAVGYFRDGDRRYRVTAMEPADEAAAKSAFATLAKTKGAAPVRGLGDEAVSFSWNEGPLTGEGIAARKGKRVYAVQDELRVLRNGMPDAERSKLVLTLEDKTKRLADLVR
jgi:hypothetical protein